MGQFEISSRAGANRCGADASDPSLSETCCQLSIDNRQLTEAFWSVFARGRAMNRLYFGDNLAVLRRYIPDESVNLVYLDPPFNSKETYNVLYKSPVGADAQERVFEDTWAWEDGASKALRDLSERDHTTFHMLEGLQRFLGTSDMMAYLAMMAVRLVELKRVMKPDASLYLHCDPTASHYLKVVMDAVFGPGAYVNEISWKRTTAKADYRQGARHFPRVRDVLLRYAKSPDFYFDQPFRPYDESYTKSKYGNVDETGRRYQLDNLTGPGGAEKGNAFYEVMGVSRYWRYSKKKMAELVAQGRIVQPRPGAVPRYKRYLDEMPGLPVSEDWDDIRPINSQAQERLHYPTQKPVELMQRILAASSRVGDVVLDPFCGCGTTIHAAELMGREWIGIDVAYGAIQVIEDRLHKWLPRAEYEVKGIPYDEHSARMMARKDWFAFQQWAVSRCRGRSGGLGGDRGVDGEIIFQRGRDEYGRAIVSVKGGKHVGPSMVRELAGAVKLHGADAGVFICLNEPTKEMRTAAHGFGRVDLPGGDRPKIQIVTVHELIAGPNLGMPTALSSIDVNQAAKRKQRQKPPKRPSPEKLRQEPPLPPMGVAGGRKRTQVPLNLGEPVLVPQQPNKQRA